MGRKAIEVSENIRVVVDIDSGCFYERRGTDALGGARWEDVCPNLEAQADALREALCEVLFPPEQAEWGAGTASVTVRYRTNPDGSVAIEQDPPLQRDESDADGWRTSPLPAGEDGQRIEICWGAGSEPPPEVCPWTGDGWADRESDDEPWEVGFRLSGDGVCWRYLPAEPPTPTATIQDRVQAVLTDESQHYVALAAAAGVEDRQALDGCKRLARAGLAERGSVRGTYRLPAKVLTNCLTCEIGGITEGDMFCHGRPNGSQKWANGIKFDERGFPPTEATGCPGWQPKPAQQPLPTEAREPYMDHLPAHFHDDARRAAGSAFAELKAEKKPNEQAARIAYGRCCAKWPELKRS